MNEIKRSAVETAAAAGGGAASSDEGKQGLRLVFGLSSRTNKLKHDEYAEQRRARASGASENEQRRGSNGAAVATAAAVSQGAKVAAAGETSSSKQTSGRTASARRPAAESVKRPTSMPKDALETSVNGGGHEEQTPDATRQVGAPKTSPPIRASKYGNFYKPLEQHNSNSAEAMAQKKPGAQSAGESTVAVAPATKTTRSRSKSPDKKSEPPKLVRRKSIERVASVVEPPSAAKTPAAATNSQRTQFNVLPPPQLSVATTGKGSVVSYAKSRIYDKPTRSAAALAAAAASGAPTPLDYGGEIPMAILRGFKPPKQVLVSKAREKWEGGEPFAKCKSRQRLAAQLAGKRLVLHGAWSMTSSVATQQLQLQQAYAQSFSKSTSASQQDPSVKLLARGSVLERVQQFERIPSTASQSSDNGDCALPNDSDASDEAVLTINDANSRHSQSGSSVSELRPASPVYASKQAQYKARVSSLQRQQVEASAFLSTGTGGAVNGLATAAYSANGSPCKPQLRRPSLRRSSSAGSQSAANNSSSPNIPKFYQPNAKPNTYEIELQKKNIVACFERLPGGKAQLAGPNHRRHFHSIALACDLSEYFKLPLCSYVRHKLSTATTTSNGAVVKRKTSASSMLTSPTGVPQGESCPTSNKPKLIGLARAASIDSPSATVRLNDKNSANNSDADQFVTCDQFLIVWRQLISSAADIAARFVHLLTFGQRKYLVADDFVPMIQSIIDDHPGLRFLSAAPDFHMRYIQTVIARFFFCINKSWTAKITIQELRRSNLLAVLQVLSHEEDINLVTDYFSYEHFYVIYCKFWNLDQDHDLLISKEDLARHNDAAISSRIIERIFAGVVSKQTQLTSKMSYSDFVWFLIAEEDKKQPRSIEYWFRLMDLDGDGYISMYEMEYFYYEQTKRLELMNIEALPFLDCACQILDLINPKEKSKISLADLKRIKPLATIFFDTFINLEKYLEHESREFVSTKDVIQDGVVVSDWERYASEEYENLVREESSV